MNNKSTAILIVLTFLGMVGLYVILYRAYQKYQDATAGGPVSALLSLFGKG